uniref:Uncharacterized protein n=1 Tax=Siphoviridae sp. ctB3v5 TaxID=2826186 RepID=A0A8S5M944_9CAUD|nr:MAG TPA: hypothetical protein [Siphoviridae sp. ctB3v5]
MENIIAEKIILCMGNIILKNPKKKCVKQNLEGKLQQQKK